jgi:hypothetical protein
MTTTVDKELKHKITERWNIISRGQTCNPFKSSREITAFAQLEYILLEAGLLAQKRAPRKVSEPMTLAGGDDNTMSLSEEVGRNYGE